MGDKAIPQPIQAPVVSSPLVRTGLLQRKCACGGTPGPDGECAGCRRKRLARQRNSSAQTAQARVPSIVHEVLRSPGQPLDPATRAFMEPRFGHDFSRVRVHSHGSPPLAPARFTIGPVNDRYEQQAEHVAHSVMRQSDVVPAASTLNGHYDFSDVRVHTDAQAAESARAVNALAYTVGNHIVFGAGRYAPTSSAGRTLLAHELVHVVQQASGPGGATSVVQRAPTLSVLDENFVGPPSATQRRAARSCPITCCDQTLGTLHAMPLFFHQSRQAQVAAGSAAATGIGAAMHFIAAGTQPRVGERCHCDDFRIIQVLETTDPAPGRGGNSYVDNSGRSTPFYSDVFLGGRGEHEIPAGYPDAGERLTTTESIYDRPYRDPATLPAANLSWMAEACVACVKNNAPDRVLGCVTYGFTRSFNATTRSFGPVGAVGPGCRSEPSQHFINTLRSDPTTSSYDFKPAPTVFECGPVGDFPLPRGDTRVA